MLSAVKPSFVKRFFLGVKTGVSTVQQAASLAVPIGKSVRSKHSCEAFGPKLAGLIGRAAAALIECASTSRVFRDGSGEGFPPAAPQNRRTLSILRRMGKIILSFSTI
jgi:hypothetical protein